MSNKQWLGLIRHLLTAVGGYLVAKGWIDESTVSELVGAVLTIIGTVWSARAPEKKDPEIAQ